VLIADGDNHDHELEPGEHYLLLDATTPRIDLRPLEPRFARVLLEAAAGGAPSLESAEAALLVEAGLLIRPQGVPT
jgi:hypothetical protein